MTTSYLIERLAVGTKTGMCNKGDDEEMLDAVLSASDRTFDPPVRTAAPGDQLLGGTKLSEWNSKAIRQMVTLGLALQLRDPTEAKCSRATGQSSFQDQLRAKLQGVMFWPQNSSSGCELVIQRAMCYAAEDFLRGKGVIPVLGDVQQTRLGAEFARRMDALRQQEKSALARCSTRLAGKRKDVKGEFTCRYEFLLFVRNTRSIQRPLRLLVNYLLLYMNKMISRVHRQRPNTRGTAYCSPANFLQVLPYSVYPVKVD